MLFLPMEQSVSDVIDDWLDGMARLRLETRIAYNDLDRQYREIQERIQQAKRKIEDRYLEQMRELGQEG